MAAADQIRRNREVYAEAEARANARRPTRPQWFSPMSDFHRSGAPAERQRRRGLRRGGCPRTSAPGLRKVVSGSVNFLPLDLKRHGGAGHEEGFEGLTVLGIAAGVAHHQLTAQDATTRESSPIHLESAETVRAKDEPDLSKVPVNQMTVIDMRILLKKLESEAIDRLDRTELQKRLEDELNRQAERKREARLEAISNGTLGHVPGEPGLAHRQASPGGPERADGATAPRGDDPHVQSRSGSPVRSAIQSGQVWSVETDQRSV